ncbi:Isoamylase 1 chloroplastic [Zea mays]|uniref:Isoamylase 1 chloroplastic n=1 Tax=Zea mays TaxID=4577 RepID=A0A1D6Q1Z0_MAIZE|nr:Isoamylase 1 chloroplastic [Zea mays]
MAATEQLKELGEKLQAVAPAPADELAKLLELIAEAWDAGGLYQVGQFPHWNVWSEWNGKVRYLKRLESLFATWYFLNNK